MILGRPPKDLPLKEDPSYNIYWRKGMYSHPTLLLSRKGRGVCI
jgi:hypothetical protein